MKDLAQQRRKPVYRSIYRSIPSSAREIALSCVFLEKSIHFGMYVIIIFYFLTRLPAMSTTLEDLSCSTLDNLHSETRSNGLETTYGRSMKFIDEKRREMSRHVTALEKRLAPLNKQNEDLKWVSIVNNIHEKITLFWLAEDSVVFCKYSAKKSQLSANYSQLSLLIAIGL